jgi:hypothetical protein
VRWLASLALLAFSLSAPSWAQASSSPSTGLPPAASGGGSPPPSATWERLDELLNLLVSSAEDSSADSRLLEASLRDARSSLTELSDRLSESATRARELSSSLERCERSLELSEESLKEARAEAARSALELRLWKWAALAGFAAGAFGLAWSFATR